MQRTTRWLLAAAGALALAGCAPDPCGAARHYASVCNLDGAIDEASFRQNCQDAMAGCTSSQQAEAAQFYQCLADNKLCTSAGFQTCAQNVTYGALTCISSFD